MVEYYDVEDWMLDLGLIFFVFLAILIIYLLAVTPKHSAPGMRQEQRNIRPAPIFIHHANINDVEARRQVLQGQASHHSLANLFECNGGGLGNRWAAGEWIKAPPESEMPEPPAYSVSNASLEAYPQQQQ